MGPTAVQPPRPASLTPRSEPPVLTKDPGTGRIRHNPRVLVASCWVNGKLRHEPVAARAEVLTDTSDLERIQELLLARYKLPTAS